MAANIHYPSKKEKKDPEGNSEIYGIITPNTGLECINPGGKAVSSLVSANQAQGKGHHFLMWGQGHCSGLRGQDYNPGGPRGRTSSQRESLLNPKV